MVLNYNFENFMSFREHAEFSMLAPDTEEKTGFPVLMYQRSQSAVF
ncbi:hypothetical protein V1226_19030 [Lachnospiraceae bacterium JLR.KK009]|jgi:hypothetical protein|nr:hypothetical protein C810_05087 [Lachnospiraceae bacterium A2]MCI8707793.1 hypothetical protein [Lachnospiraceae bacterium]MCI8883998.1 hypothetical protein [Lachnospiraceae bacterium]